MCAEIFFNGKYVGRTREPEKIAGDIRSKRRQNLLLSDVNVAYLPQHNEVRINTGHGRVRRPLIIVENEKPKLTEVVLKKLGSREIGWKWLVENGVIEYLDAEEEENSYVALKPEDVTSSHTHLEIDPVSMLGVSTTLIPYPEFSRGDRINFGAKMIGQAIGLAVTNFDLRTDTKFNFLFYPQTPLVETNTSEMLGKYPGGHNVVIAIMSSDGYNINDAVVMNKSSVQRGMFTSFYFRTYEITKKRYWGGQEDTIEVPAVGVKGFRGEDTYKDMGEDGIINQETPVESDSVLAGRTSPLRFLTTEEFIGDIENKRDTSVCVRHGEKGIVDKIFITETPDASHIVKVRVRDRRIPEIGDKFASRHGQKGVVGLLLNAEDMPFTADGIVPDIVFNPHAIPSRMTVGHLLEIIAGKVGALTGRKINATAFNYTKEEDLRSAMKKLGFRDDGKQTLYNGKTGEKYDVMIFTGLVYYMKLDHMVTDKIYARSRGPVTLLTKQPTEGRAKKGGLRLGEMEQQCIVGHGAALTLKERFDSDKTFIHVCKKCGLIATYDAIKNRAYCNVCKGSAIAIIETAYAFKLTLDELKTMGIHPKLHIEEV